MRKHNFQTSHCKLYKQCLRHWIPVSPVKCKIMLKDFAHTSSPPWHICICICPCICSWICICICILLSRTYHTHPRLTHVVFVLVLVFVFVFVFVVVFVFAKSLSRTCRTHPRLRDTSFVKRNSCFRSQTGTKYWRIGALTVWDVTKCALTLTIQN